MSTLRKPSILLNGLLLEKLSIILNLVFARSSFNLVYRDIQTCVRNNDRSAGFFELSRGVRQGYPLSPYIFILCAEELATTIRKDNEVKGITVGSTECKLSQYANDTTLILDGTQKSLVRSFVLLEKFGEASGL